MKRPDRSDALSETALIEWIRRRTPADARVRVGIGDDAAVVRLPGGLRGRAGAGEMALKTDMIVENVHFTRRDSTPEDWGYKAIAVNLSDLAAMGAEPAYALAAVGLPRGFGAAAAKAVFRGMEKAMRLGGVRLVGGDTCRAERVTIAVFMAGFAGRGKMLLRSGARPGDALFVTGKLGGSLVRGRHLRFIPRLEESRFLTRHYRVRAMMDLSDGLAKDLRHLCEASRSGAELWEKSIPVHPDAGRRGVRAALCDGEDFELLFALAPSEAARLERDPAVRRKGFCFYRIGRVTRHQQGYSLVTHDGKKHSLPAAPDHHFGS